MQRHHPLRPDADTIALPDGTSVGFNGRKTIAKKTWMTLEAEVGGVMIWEAGQDCRMVAVTHGETTHGVTCPKGRESSLLVAISRALVSAGRAKEAAARAAAKEGGQKGAAGPGGSEL